MNGGARSFWATLGLMVAQQVAAAEVYEVPADESPAASLSAAQVSGKYFHIEDPVHCDGLMHRYVIESRFGTFSAYGTDALNVRLKEIAALTAIADSSDTSVVLKAAVRGTQEQAKAVIRMGTHPVGTVIGVPRGIAHLLGGYRARAEEVTGQAKQALASGSDNHGGAASAGELANKSVRAAENQAKSFLGVPAAERRWYNKLGVDPYTNNSVLRDAVKHLARIDATASFGMRFAPIGIPFAGEVEKALDTIDHEDPAVLTKRRRADLASYGLTTAEIEQFEHTALLTPTRQTLLVDTVRALEAVEGRAELLRHAMTVESEEEVEVFLQSTLLLRHFHVQRILAGPRIPTAELPDGHIAVFGSFDAVQWTEQVAGYERALREALPAQATKELWLTGTVSGVARAALEQHGWVIHDRTPSAVAAAP